MTLISFAQIVSEAIGAFNFWSYVKENLDDSLSLSLFFLLFELSRFFRA